MLQYLKCIGLYFSNIDNDIRGIVFLLGVGVDVAIICI